jgi:uncharacterized protein (TIGR01370 family)
MYLDVVDVYEFYESRGFSDARTAMQRFVIELANTGRTLRPDFLVIVQNAAELISAPLYLETIDGLAKEDTWFDGDQRRSWEDTAWDLQHMERVQNAGKIVLAVDYPTQAVHAMRFCRNAARRGFLPLTAPRELDRLRSPPSLACQPLILPQTARPTSDKPGRHTDAQ